MAMYIQGNTVILGKQEIGVLTPWGNSEWWLFHSRVPLLTLSEREELLSLLAREQDLRRIPTLNIGSLLDGRILDQEMLLDEFTRTKWVFPFTYDFFPVNPNTETRAEFLKWWCLPIEERYQNPQVFASLHATKWVRHLDLEGASARDTGIFGLAYRYGPEACYSSGITKTRMLHLVPGHYLDAPVLEYKEFPTPRGPLRLAKLGNEYYVPVIRFAREKTVGLFFNEDIGTACGTFFYYEPESENYLRSVNPLVSGNKYMATLTLVESLADKIDPENRLSIQFDLLNFEEILDDIPEDYNDNPNTLSANSINKLYAKEDKFDQLLCPLARAAGYDVVILTHMAGHGRLVTEVLDTRSREKSLGNIYTMDG